MDRILVIQVGRIGDTLLTTPALLALARSFPAAEVHVAAHRRRMEVLENLPWLASVRPISKNRAPWLGRLGRKRYAHAIVYGQDRALIDYAARVSKEVVAYRQAEASFDPAVRFVEKGASWDDMHWIDRFLLLPEAIGAKAATRRIQYVVSDDERSKAQATLRSRGAADAEPLVGIQMASFPTRAHRDWPKEHFHEVCKRILGKWAGAKFLLLGGPDDVERTRWLAEQLGPCAVNVAGTTTLREVGALIGELDAYVGVDTGPSHLASAFEFPMVVFYHCLSPSLHLAPIGRPRTAIIDHPHLATGECTMASDMADITPERVFGELVRVMGEGR